MIVFIGWSGTYSKLVAIGLRAWLPTVIQQVKPWMSEEDIESGAVWETELSSRLEEANFGIITLTRENMLRPWVNFEAGALSKKVGLAKVCPYLIDISEKTEVTGPLTKFQMKKANREDTFSLINDINKALGEGKLPDPVLNTTFERFWPDLEKVIAVPPSAPVDPPKRTERELLEEILERARSMQQQVSKFAESERIRQFLTDALSARGLSRKTFRSISDATLKEWLEEEMSPVKVGALVTNLEANEKKKNGEDDEK